MTDRIRARHEGTRRILPHNDLIAAAAYHKEVIEEKIASNDRRAIAYDYLACMLALAFLVEAIVNFVGQSKVTPWNEKAPTKDKYKTVLRELNLTPDWNKSPYCSVSKLKDFRDLIVHPKPIIEEFDEEVVMPASEADRPSLELDSEWMNYCSHDTVMQTYGDVLDIYDDLVKAAGIPAFETQTSGQSSLRYIETLKDN